MCPAVVSSGNASSLFHLLVQPSLLDDGGHAAVSGGMHRDLSGRHGSHHRLGHVGKGELARQASMVGQEGL